MSYRRTTRIASRHWFALVLLFALPLAIFGVPREAGNPGTRAPSSEHLHESAGARRASNDIMGQLEVLKDLDPPTDPGRFDLFIDGELYHANAADGDSTGPQTVYVGYHTVSESVGDNADPEDYLSSIACRDNGGTGALVASTDGVGPLDVPVGEGQHVQCVVTNVRVATIAVQKATIPGGDPTCFNFRGDITAHLCDGMTASTRAAPGSHTVQEVVPVEWNLIRIACDDPGGSGDLAAATATYEVAAGQTIQCTFTNERQSASLEVVKRLVPYSAPGLFHLMIDGAIESPDARDGASTGIQAVFSGIHTVGEVGSAGTDLAGYSTTIECRHRSGQGRLVASGNGPGPLALALNSGDDIVCVLTNRWPRVYWLHLPLLYKGSATTSY